MAMDGRKKFNAMTVDVEDYFQVAAFDALISPSEWDSLAYRAGESTRKLLDLFDENNVKATFFTLGWVARRDPDLIRQIVSRGHELASHGFSHQKVFTQTQKEFSDDLLKSKKLLEDLSGERILGYRAPSFSIDERNEWAFDVLKECGFIYSSSTYPIAHDHYGTPSWPTKPYTLPNGLLELPQSTVEMMNKRLPVGGGGYFRLFPLLLSNYLLNKFHNQHDHPYIFYFHPWEIDSEQPKVAGASAKSAFRHYVNLSRMEKKIAAMCERHQWLTIKEAFGINEGERCG